MSDTPSPPIPAPFDDVETAEAVAKELFDGLVRDLDFTTRFTAFGARVLEGDQRPVLTTPGGRAAFLEAGTTSLALPEKPCDLILPANPIGFHASLGLEAMHLWDADMQARMIAAFVATLAADIADRVESLFRMAGAKADLASAEALVHAVMGDGPTELVALASGTEAVLDRRAMVLALLPTGNWKQWMTEGEHGPVWHVDLVREMSAGLVLGGACRLYAVGPGPVTVSPT